MKAIDIFNQLNITDELAQIEAKSGTKVSNSIMETICAFANEPGLGGGYILMGAVKDESSLFPQYIVQEVQDPDQIQSDLATQCATLFNISLRPEISIEQVNGKNVVVVKINELTPEQKPLYFKKDGLPAGAFRRIGPTDHRCTEDDMPIFYSDQKTYDQSLLDGTRIEDIDEVALARYRKLRSAVNPSAEELNYTDDELLQSLGCIANDGSNRLSVAGLLLFGKSISLRRIFPMIRVDYIRVPGHEWVSDPDERFTTIDMRGALILLLFRIVDAIYTDLPKGFRLDEDELQADSIGIPVKVLREAVTNALMHRSYRVNSPIQVIRYDNRIEIHNPGFSLKSEDKLGLPGSETRNPFIAAVFHETNLAETKGSGIRAMRRLLKTSHLAPPTFESNRNENKFVIRLLLHHFLSSEDVKWLAQFDNYNLNDTQKQVLIFVREVGAIDNNTYRQLSDTDTLKASGELRTLRDSSLISQKGKGRGTYYIAGKELSKVLAMEPSKVTIEPSKVTTEPSKITTEPSKVTTEPSKVTTEPSKITTEPSKITTEPSKVTTEPRTPDENEDALPEGVTTLLNSIGKKEHNKEKVFNFIVALCRWKPHTLNEIAAYLDKGANHVSREYIKPLLERGELKYTYSDMINHPNQSYSVN